MFNNAKKWLLSAGLALTLCFGITQSASAQIVLPDVGVDVGGHITAAITAVGAVALIAVGGYFAFMVVRKALQWGRTSIR